MAEQRRVEKTLLAQSAREARQAPKAERPVAGGYLRTFSYQARP